MSKLKPYPFLLLQLDEIQEEIQKAFIETLDDEEVFTPETNEEEEAEEPKPFHSVRVNQHQDSGGLEPPPYVFRPHNLQEVDCASLEHLPIFFGAIKDVALNAQAPGPMIVISALGTAATIVPGLYDVKSPLGMVHPTCLNTIVIALSGERKTTVDKYFAKVFAKILELINKKVEELNENFESNLERWQIENIILRKAYMDARKKGDVEIESSESPTDEESQDQSLAERLDEDEGESVVAEENSSTAISDEEQAYLEHQKLKPQRLDSLSLIHDDFTIGSVLQSLYTNLPVASITTSEGAKVLDDASLKVVPFLNKLWDAASIQVSRIVRGSFWLHNVRLSSSLMIQPDVMRKVMDKRYEELRGSGYFSRAIVSNPSSNIGARPVFGTQQHTENLDKFHARLAEMMIDLLRSLTDPDFKRKELELDEEAAHMWLQFANDVEIKMSPGGLYEFVTDHGSKLPENVLRTAGVLHALEFGEGKISAKTLNAAIQICLRSSKDFVELFNPVPQEERNGVKLKKYLYENYVRFIENAHWTELYFDDRFISQNRVLQCGPFTKAEELNLGLRWLQFQQCVRVVKELPLEGKGRSKYYIDLAPGNPLPRTSPNGRELLYVTIH